MSLSNEITQQSHEKLVQNALNQDKQVNIVNFQINKFIQSRETPPYSEEKKNININQKMHNKPDFHFVLEGYDMMKAEKSEVSIGYHRQALLPTTFLSQKQIQLKKQNLHRLKIWDAKTDTENKQIMDLFKLFKRKFGRNAQHLEEFFTILQRTKQDFELIKQLMQYEEKFLKNYLQRRCQERKNEVHQ